jgi:hypothetical protein
LSIPKIRLGRHATAYTDLMTIKKLIGKTLS